MPTGAASAFKTLGFELPIAAHKMHELPIDTITRFEFAFLLDGFLLEDELCANQFDALVRPVLFRMAKKRRFELPLDQKDDVVQETFLALFRKSVVRFDPERGVFSDYLLGRILNSLKAIRSQYDQTRVVVVPLDEMKNPLLSKDTVEAFDSVQIAKRILEGVPAPMREACFRVLAENEAQTVVAVEMGLTRYALARKIRAVKLAALKMSA